MQLLKTLFTLFIAFSVFEGTAQNVGINEDGSIPQASAILDIKSDSKGVLIPRLTTAQRTAITTPATGLMVYDTNTSGFWYYDGASWVEIASGVIAGNTLDEAYDQGGAGAGRTITADGGAVYITGTDGLRVSGTFGSGATVGNPGPGAHLFFNPRKAAFRAGSVAGPAWNNANVGEFSVALGQNLIASGLNSLAFGFTSVAYAERAIAIGSYAEGIGVESTAIGYSPAAEGDRSVAIGTFADAFATGSIALGGTVNAAADHGLAGPLGTVDGENAFAMGQLSVASGARSFAFGYNDDASGQTSTAIGTGNTASGDYSLAMGIANTASDEGAVALGFGNDATGRYSFALGTNSEATADAAIALGGFVEASGNFSFATGYFTIAEGFGSAALNWETSAQAFASTAVGRFNVGGGDPTTWVSTDPLFEIGIGADGVNPANAITVLKNGNTGIMNATPDATLDVVGTFQLVDGTEGAGKVLTSDASGNATWNTPASAAGPVAFSAVLTSWTSVNPLDNFSQSAVELSSNCTFNTGSSTFIVPEDGVYSFTVHDYSAGSANSTQGVIVRVNGTTAKRFNWQVASSYEAHTFTFLLDLTAFDSVGFVVTGSRTLIGSTSAGGPRCNISGHLIR